VTPALHAQSVLDHYIQEGLKSNLVLQQKYWSLKQAEQSLASARSYFLPSVNVLADYTHGKGGRSIGIPVGDLLNPVYASLNQMTETDAFPQIENVSEDFFPKNFYDTRIRTSLPLINTDLHINKTIQGEKVMLKQYEIDSYKRQLILDIKTAYYNLLSAEVAVKIFESAMLLVERNISINEALLENGKNLHANVIRSKSEAEKVKADLNSSRNQVLNARAYFNFLLNRELHQNVTTQGIPESEKLIFVSDTTNNRREEIQMLNTLQGINHASVKMSKLNRLPKVNAFFDLGSQASNWQFNDDTQYYLVGIQLSLPLFNGFRNNINIRQQQAEIAKTEQQILYSEKQVALASVLANNDQQTATQNFYAAQEQLRSAQSYFNLIEKGYQEGVNALIEYIDARNQLTTSLLQKNLRQFEMLITEARVERESASYNLHQ
jgi:outer membrane protein TolC